MRIDIITLFPSMFTGPFDTSMLLKAQENSALEIYIHDLREFGLGLRRQVDDGPYGGGDGMVLKPEPVYAAVRKTKQLNPEAKVVIMTPTGKLFKQALTQELAEFSGLIILAGHYEGFDERILNLADYEISIGDYVLTGGEIPAMVIVDSVARLLPGVLGGAESAAKESFQDGLLEHPHYTRPAEFEGLLAPEVLQQGNHAEIEKWRKQQSIIKTKKNRPDLL